MIGKEAATEALREWARANEAGDEAGGAGGMSEVRSERRP